MCFHRIISVQRWASQKTVRMYNNNKFNSWNTVSYSFCYLEHSLQNIKNKIVTLTYMMTCIELGQFSNYNNPVFVVYTLLWADGKTLDGRYILYAGVQMTAWRITGIVFTLSCLFSLLALLGKSPYFDCNFEGRLSVDILLVWSCNNRMLMVNKFLMRYLSASINWSFILFLQSGRRISRSGEGNLITDELIDE